jgi:hypothetical protein
VLLRLLFLLLLAFLLLYLIKGYRTRSRRSRHPPLRAADDMAFDPQCQSYVPKGEAIEAGGQYFCSRECAERYLADRRNDARS